MPRDGRRGERKKRKVGGRERGREGGFTSKWSETLCDSDPSWGGGEVGKRATGWRGAGGGEAKHEWRERVGERLREQGVVGG